MPKKSLRRLTLVLDETLFDSKVYPTTYHGREKSPGCRVMRGPMSAAQDAMWERVARAFDAMGSFGIDTSEEKMDTHLNHMLISEHVKHVNKSVRAGVAVWTIAWSQ